MVNKIISIGNICVDRILGHIDDLPAWGTEVFFDRYEERLAGQGANFAIATARFGFESWLVGSVGGDAAGEKILSELSRVKNLNCDFVRKEKNAPTGFTISLIRTDGERLFLTSLGHQKLFSLAKDRSKLLHLIKERDLVHVSGFFMLPKIRRELRSFMRDTKLLHRAKTSFDPGWDPEGFGENTKSVIYSVLPYFDFFEPNSIELSALAGEMKRIEQAAKKIGEKYPGTIVLKEGKEGSRAFQQGKAVARVEPFEIKVDETTGAGDVFDAGFLCGVLKGYELAFSLRLGNAAASIIISRESKMNKKTRSLPNFRELLRYSGLNEIKQGNLQKSYHCRGQPNPRLACP